VWQHGWKALKVFHVWPGTSKKDFWEIEQPFSQMDCLLHLVYLHRSTLLPCSDLIVWWFCLQYAHYPTLPEIIGRFSRYMKEVGEAVQVPARGAAAAQLARL